MEKENKRFAVRSDFYSEGPPLEKASKILDGALERVDQEGIDKNKILGFEMSFHENIGLSSEIEDDEEERKNYFMSFTFFDVQE
jgi:hypothetical protein